MAKTNAGAAATTITASQILGLDRWIVPEDPSDPTSRTMFVPWRCSIDKSGMFKFSHPGNSDPILKKKIEVIFLSEIKETQCRCTLRDDKSNTVVCSSHDRVYSNKGFVCKECPYANITDKDGNKLYRRPLGQTAVFLFRPEGTDEPFQLARYISTLNNVRTLVNLKNTFRQMLVAQGNPNPFPSNNVCVLSAVSESIQQGSVGRFSKEIEVGAGLDADAVKIVAGINAKVMELYEQMFKRMSEKNIRMHEQLAAKSGRTATPQQESVPTAQAAQQPEKPAYEVPPSMGSEDIGNAILGDDDDDLPF